MEMDSKYKWLIVERTYSPYESFYKFYDKLQNLSSEKDEISPDSLFRDFYDKLNQQFELTKVARFENFKNISMGTYRSNDDYHINFTVRNINNENKLIAFFQPENPTNVMGNPISLEIVFEYLNRVNPEKVIKWQYLRDNKEWIDYSLQETVMLELIFRAKNKVLFKSEKFDVYNLDCFEIFQYDIMKNGICFTISIDLSIGKQITVNNANNKIDERCDVQRIVE